eukprot:TRINITY_DN1151_c0_g1_i2.p1 TRINITY_DN1151_c0_g1~~TRINITY_DN1151_c0_g1_i2.p1  ORF type:complete len:609 (+),score=190.58 TRINITY_DN1151_c0_g1_i2:84-1910(+)
MASASNTEDLPRTKFALRGKHGTELHWGAPKFEKDPTVSVPNTGPFVFSRDGTHFATATSQGVTVYSSESGKKISFIMCKAVELAFSPLNTYLMTWNRPAKNGPPNLRIWTLPVGGEPEAVFEAHQRSVQDNWPCLHFSDDEKLMGYVTTNTVTFYDGKNLPTVTTRFNIPNVASFKLAPGPAPYKFSVFVPENKGAPGRVAMYHYPETKTPVAQKSFYRCDKVSMMWNSTATALLCLTVTEVDATGKSYYGETGLYFMSADGKLEHQIQLDKEGPIYDVQWSPTGRDFCVVFGFMPAKQLLFDQRGEPVFDFGSGPRNTVIWSPHGRFLAIAGFGNLAGEMDFWDRNKLKIMGRAQSNCAVSYSWSADSRHFITATTFPRLRVDNGYKVYTYYGELVKEEKVEELYQIKWRPALPSVYPDRPQSPRLKHMQVPEKQVKKVQAYRPPGMRGEVNFNHRREDEERDQGKKLDRQARAKVQNHPPGYVPDSDANSKAEANRKKRERKKAAAAARALQQEQQEAMAKAEAKLNPAAAAGKPGAADTSKDPTQITAEEAPKRIKALNKKLRQIDALKEKKAAGAEISPEQEAKLASEGDLKKEIAALEKLVV